MSTSNAGELVITRTFNAPKQAVWDAFTTADALAKWWGPKGFTMLKVTLDFRPGGVFHYGMKGPQGNEMWGKFVYQEISAPDSMVFINSFSDSEGGITPNPWMPNWPLQVINHVTFEEKEGKTTVTLRGGPINATEEQCKLFEENRPNMQQGFNGTWSQLDEYLAQQ